MVMVLIAACGNSRGDASASGDTDSAASGTPPASVQSKDFLKLLVAQPRPTLVGPWAPLKLTPELTISQARRQAPDLVQQNNAMHALEWFEYKGRDYPGVSLRLERVGQIDCEPDDWTIGRLRAVLTDLTAKDKLTKAWGPPLVTGERATWFDPPSHLRCSLATPTSTSRVEDAPPNAQIIDCMYYTPLAELIGTSAEHFGFEGDAPILGATQRKLKGRFGCRDRDEGIRIQLPPTELAEEYTSIVLTDELDAPDKVTYWKMTLPGDATALPKLLEAKFGKPKTADLDLIYRAKAARVVLRGSELIVGDEPKE